MKHLLLIMVFCPLFIKAQVKSTDIVLQEVATVFTTGDGLPEVAFESVFENKDGKVVAQSQEGTYIFDEEGWKKYEGKIAPKDRSVHNPVLGDAGEVYARVQYNESNVIGAENGLFQKTKGEKGLKEIFPEDENYSWAPRYVKVVEVDTKNRLWFGTTEGIGVQQEGKWSLYTGKEGLPYNQFTCVEKGLDGEVWFGTDKGVVRTNGEEFHYRFSRRWLPGDVVNDILVQADGSAWIATNKGVSRITFQQMTYEEKGAYFTRQVEERHNRDGFVVQNRLAKQFDPTSFRYDISDNDGMYTSMYGAAQAFRYAATGDPEAKKLADRSFKACKWLVDITHEKGFPARVIIPVDWPDPVNEIYGSEYNKRMRERDPLWKLITPRFVKSSDGQYLWKCDTSSDELSGHYFFYGLYYDLVAETAEEKEAVRTVVRDITDHLIRNGFVLRDHDGLPTRWADFSPEFLNSAWGWDQRGLNAMMMLSFLSVASHVTGDKKYDDTAAMLRDKYQYHIHAMQSKMFFPPMDVVPWDNNLCLMSMYGLLKYEKDPALILMYQKSLLYSWLHISLQRNAFWNVIYASLFKRFDELVKSGVYASGEIFPKMGPFTQHTAEDLLQWKCAEEDITGPLKVMPLDLIGYSMDNTHRLDIIFDQTPGQDPEKGIYFGKTEGEKSNRGWHVNGRALPLDERGHVRQDRDGFLLHQNEGNGFSEQEGTFYLLPYYMARYYKFIE